ncbi:MAG: ATP-binding protein [Clostridia bacterium]|jgi:predicted AAA+ superfamily ATPase|nr:ATP-binding protein [Clostridia bacterium]
MLKRKITKILEEWKNEENKQCLLIRGARQVGKTFIIEQFCKENYESYIYINFDLSPTLKDIFNGNLDANTLIMKLEVTFPNIEIKPGKTVLFLDEIQSCPNARVALKSFAIDKRIDVIASGSLLGLYYKEITSYPVGYERIVDMYPLDFEEFLWAIGIKENIILEVKKCFKEKKPVDEYILKQLNEQFKLFLIVGGMPRIVDEYTKEKSLGKVMQLQKSMIEDYKLDVVKYAETNVRQKVLNTFDSIPAQLAKKNKKFSYVNILEGEQNVGERKYSSSIEWLKNAGIINYCYNLTEPAAPLKSNLRLDCFKIYMRDTGLLMSMYEQGIQKDILNDELYINEGAIIENVCAAELKTRYQDIMYYEKKSQLEIDFILNIEGTVTAIEVKSGKNKQSKSLNSIVQNYKTVARYIKMENDTNLYIDELGIEHYPLFMIMFL